MYITLFIISKKKSISDHNIFGIICKSKIIVYKADLECGFNYKFNNRLKIIFKKIRRI